MPGTLIKLTNAGRAALVGPGNVGTVTRTITKIGVATAAFVHDDGLLALPNERKQLDTFGGENVSPDTVHVTLRDDTEDEYTLYGFGLYLENGVLLGTYSQDTPILEKSPAAILLLSADMVFTSIDAALLQFGSSNWTNPPATEARQGVVELATQTETNAGLDDSRAVTPKKLANRIAALVNDAPAQLDTLGELAASIANDPNFASTVAAALANKANAASPNFTGVANYSGGPSWTSAGWGKVIRLSTSQAIEFSNANANFGVGNSGGVLMHFVASVEDASAPPTYYMTVSSGGIVGFNSRPVFAGQVPWDTGNFNPSLYTLKTDQATESNQGTVKVATQAQTNAGTDDTTAVTPKKLLAWVKQATEAVLGMAKVATQAQTDAGTDDATIVTPKKLRFGFSSVFGANGYIAFPSWLGGLILQWGKTGTFPADSTDYTIVHYVAFPNTCFAVFLTDYALNSNAAVVKVSSVTRTNFTASQYQVQGASAGHSYFHFSIGN